jgi:mannose-6-phosphate isomerase-like protein (cupin superfamily)
MLDADRHKEFFTEERCFITEILNRSEHDGMSIARARVEPHVSTQLHKLSVDEVYYVLEGRGEVQINNKSKQVIGKGDSILIHSGESQMITNILSVDLVFLCICSPRFIPESYTSLE